MLAFYLILLTRAAVFVVFLIAGVVAATHWAVQHRRLKPFDPWPRGVRRLGAPFVQPLEGRLLRSGGNPSNAPYVFFWVALLGGLVLIAAVQWAIGAIFSLSASASAGPRGLLVFAVNGIFSILMIALFIRVIASWFGISPYSGPMRVVHGLTDWMIGPLRRVVPPFGPLDVTPMVAYLLLWVARGLVMGLL
jgi:YggT family protein